MKLAQLALTTVTKDHILTATATGICVFSFWSLTVQVHGANLVKTQWGHVPQLQVIGFFAVSLWHREIRGRQRCIYGGVKKQGVEEIFPVLKVTLIFIKCSTVRPHKSLTTIPNPFSSSSDRKIGASTFGPQQRHHEDLFSIGRTLGKRCCKFSP